MEPALAAPSLPWSCHACTYHHDGHPEASFLVCKICNVSRSSGVAASPFRPRAAATTATLPPRTEQTPERRDPPAADANAIAFPVGHASSRTAPDLTTRRDRDPAGADAGKRRRLQPAAARVPTPSPAPVGMSVSPGTSSASNATPTAGTRAPADRPVAAAARSAATETHPPALIPWPGAAGASASASASASRSGSLTEAQRRLIEAKRAAALSVRRAREAAAAAAKPKPKIPSIFNMGSRAPKWDPLYAAPELLRRLRASSKHRRVHLGPREYALAERKGIETLKAEARKIVLTRISELRGVSDGRQTPMRGHPVFLAQHATGICCRDCVLEWHGIPKRGVMSAKQLNHLHSVLAAWLETTMAIGVPEGCGCKTCTTLD